MSSSAARKSSAQSSGQLVPQPHGGALRRGNPGNRGGSQPSSQVRDRLRGSFAQRVPVLEQFADGYAPLTQKCEKCGHEATVEAEPISTADRLRALDLMAKYSLGEKQEMTLVSPDIQRRVVWMIDVINSRDTWTPAELREALTPVWSE